MVQYLKRLVSKNVCQSIRNYTNEAAKNVFTKSIPTPNKLPVLHTFSVMRKTKFGKHLHKYVDDLHLELGPIFRETLGPVSAVFICDPNEMRRVFAYEGKYPVHVLPEAWLLFNEIYRCKRGLYFMNGEEWLKYRKLLNPLLLKNFNSLCLLEWCEPMLHSLLDEWFACSKDGEILNLELKLYELSINFMVALMVGSSFPNHLQEIRSVSNSLALKVRDIFKESVNLSQIPARFAAKLQLPAWKRFVEAVQTSFDLATKLMEDMLPKVCSDGLIYQLKQQGIPMKKVTNIVVDFILAAGDTTALTTQWALYLLSIHPEIQAAVVDEFRSGNLIKTCESDLMRGILRETLRLYPTAPFITRFLPEDIKVFDSYTIPAGEMIILNVYSSGRNDSYFPEADEFLPCRWKRNDEGHYPGGVNDPFASLPYAMGARSCIGRKIAQSQICFTLAMICKKYEVEPMNVVDMVLHLIPVPDNPIRLHFVPRTGGEVHGLGL